MLASKSYKNCFTPETLIKPNRGFSSLTAEVRFNYMNYSANHKICKFRSNYRPNVYVYNDKNNPPIINTQSERENTRFYFYLFFGPTKFVQTKPPRGGDTLC